MKKIFLLSILLISFILVPVWSANAELSLEDQMEKVEKQIVEKNKEITAADNKYYDIEDIEEEEEEYNLRIEKIEKMNKSIESLEKQILSANDTEYLQTTLSNTREAKEEQENRLKENKLYILYQQEVILNSEKTALTQKLTQLQEQFNQTAKINYFRVVPFPTGNCPIAGGTCVIPTYDLKKDATTLSTGKKFGYCDIDQFTPCEYSVCDMVQLFVNVTKIIIGIIGSLVLLFFIYASILFITAQGKSEQIDKAKKVLQNAVVGLLIVMFSYQIIGYLLSVLITKNILSTDAPTVSMPGITRDNWADLSGLCDSKEDLEFLETIKNLKIPE